MTDIEREFAGILDMTRRVVLQRAEAQGGILRVSPETRALLGALMSMSIPEPEQPTVESTTLDALALEVAACTRCQIHASRRQTVFSDGSPEARLVFVGEAPGGDEDREGVPFVGAAGHLLTRIIENALNMKRAEVYICNVLKCRPPGNRNPLPEEIQACYPFLERQLSLLRPKVICALGNYAAQTLLGVTPGVGKLRGQWHWYKDIPVRVTYHPSYILHKQDTPEEERKAKQLVWEDIKCIRRVLDGQEILTPP